MENGMNISQAVKRVDRLTMANEHSSLDSQFDILRWLFLFVQSDDFTVDIAWIESKFTTVNKKKCEKSF